MLPVSQRISFVYLEHGKVRMRGAVPMLIERINDSVQETPIPIGRLACLMMGPGTSISHDVLKVCADAGCLLLWTGEYGVRVYSAGIPGGAAGHNTLRQAKIILDPQAKLLAARRLYRNMMGEEPPDRRSIEQLRGLEGVWVRNRYAELAKLYGVAWSGRNHRLSDAANRAISMSTSTLYGIAEAAILAMGYSPALGIVHCGDDRSLVFDVADTVKFRTVVPLAFRVVVEHGGDKELLTTVRRWCRDLFVKEKMLELLVQIIQEVFDDGLDGSIAD